MEPLIIIGAGGLAREALEAVEAANSLRLRWSFSGFLDDDPALEGTAVNGYPVLGPIEMVADHQDAYLLVCIASPMHNADRKAVVDRLAVSPERMATVIHPAATVSRSTDIGPGSIILATAVTTANVSIGSHVIVMPGAVFTHDDVIDDFVTFGSGARLGGRVRVREGAYIGAGASVREGRSVGALAVVGMGAVVTKDVPPGEQWFGVPARRRHTIGGADASSRRGVGRGSS